LNQSVLFNERQMVLGLLDESGTIVDIFTREHVHR